MMKCTFKIINKNNLLSHPVDNSIRYKVRCNISHDLYGDLNDVIIDIVVNENGIFPNMTQIGNISPIDVKRALMIKLKEYIKGIL